jgi:hypothetical protein
VLHGRDDRDHDRHCGADECDCGGRPAFGVRLHLSIVGACPPAYLIPKG